MHHLRPYQGRTITIIEVTGFRVEFLRGPDGAVDELIFHQTGHVHGPANVSSWPISVPNPVGRRGCFQGYCSRACEKVVRQFMTQSGPPNLFRQLTYPAHRAA
jgi:hypothetical protein